VVHAALEPWRSNDDAEQSVYFLEIITGGSRAIRVAGFTFNSLMIREWKPDIKQNET
jgi:hypothetical protein